MYIYIYVGNTEALCDVYVSVSVYMGIIADVTRGKINAH